MTQLTSDGAFISPPPSDLHRSPYALFRTSETNLRLIFLILTANDESIDSFYVLAVFCLQILHVVPRGTALSFGYAPGTKGEMDFNHLAHMAAARFYCEYRTRERIHRGVADPRLLAIPASWGQVSAPNPNWGRV